MGAAVAIFGAVVGDIRRRWYLIVVVDWVHSWVAGGQAGWGFNWSSWAVVVGGVCLQLACKLPGFSLGGAGVLWYAE